MKSHPKFQHEAKNTLLWGSNININSEIQKSYVKYSGNSNSETKVTEISKKDDFELQKSVLNIIKWNSSIDETKIKVSVESGWATLEGTVDLEFKRTKAELLAKDINGVRGVTNLITIYSDLHS